MRASNQWTDAAGLPHRADTLDAFDPVLGIRSEPACGPLQAGCGPSVQSPSIAASTIRAAS